MEFLSDKTGSVTLGWITRDVFYARCTGALSTRLGGEHNHCLLEALEACTTLRYFSDSRELTSYDLLARSAFVRLVLANRRKFADIVILTWAGGISSTTEAFKAAIGEPAAIVTNSSEFEQRLIAAAPRARDFLKATKSTADDAQGAKPQRSARRPTPPPDAAYKRHK